MSTTTFEVPLSGEPIYHNPAAGNDFIDARFAPLDSRGNGLKTFVEAELNCEAAERTPPAVVHVAGAEFRVWFDGQWRTKGVLNGELHRYSGQTREQVMDKLVALAREEARPIRNLTRSEELEVARLCQGGNKLEGIARYLRYRLGEQRGAGYRHAEAMTADPELQNVLAECSLFTWLNSRPDVRDSSEFRKFVVEYAGDRPVNHDILDAAWTAFQAHQQKQVREEAVARFAMQEEPTAREIQQAFEEMDDSQIEAQFWKTAKFATSRA